MQISLTTASAKTTIPTIMYSKRTVNVRAKPNKKSKIVGIKHWNQPVQVIGKTNKRWSKIYYRGKIRYFCNKYLSSHKTTHHKNRRKYRKYPSPSTNSFKAYEDARCITDKSSPNYKLKSRYKLDQKSGVYMVGNRYCVALGSYYTTKIGTKVDLVLKHHGRKHILKCILADQKSDRHTINNHKVNSNGSVAEFVVNTNTLSKKTKLMGDVSYTSKKFRGKVTQIRVYKRK